MGVMFTNLAYLGGHTLYVFIDLCICLFIASGNETWLAGKSTINMMVFPEKSGKTCI